MRSELITVLVWIASGLLTIYVVATRPGDSPPSVQTPPTGGIPEPAPEWAPALFEECGQASFLLVVGDNVHAGEPFDISLRMRNEDTDAFTLLDGERCDYGVRLSFLSGSPVSTSPDPELTGLPVRSPTAELHWNGMTAAPGRVGVTALIFGDNLISPISLTTEVEVGGNRRIADGDAWFAAVAGAITIDASPQDTLTRGRRSAVRVGISAPGAGSPPPGTADAGTADVCLEATGGATAARECTAEKVRLDQPLRIDTGIAVEVVGTDPVTVSATVRLTGTVDGAEVGGYTSTRSTPAGPEPTVAAWDAFKIFILASREALITAAAVITALGAVGLAWRRRRERGVDGPPPAEPPAPGPRADAVDSSPAGTK